MWQATSWTPAYVETNKNFKTLKINYKKLNNFIHKLNKMYWGIPSGRIMSKFKVNLPDIYINFLLISLKKTNSPQIMAKDIFTQTFAAYTWKF